MTMNKKEEILKKMQSLDNPLREIIKFNEDKVSFTNFENKVKKIIGDDGRFFFEELAREVLMQTLLKDEKKIYSTENYYNGLHRSDLIAKIDKDISSIIEVKETNEISPIQLNKLIDDSFNQIKNFYVNDTNEFQRDCFVSVVVLNLEKITNDTDVVTKYFNLGILDRKDKQVVFSKYGIYIETRRYDNINKSFSINSWPNLARHGDFSIKDSAFSIGGLKKIYCEIQNAIKLPSSSTNSYGIKNVRNIKNPNVSAEKRDLILSIIKTSLEAFETQNPAIITNAGKDKDFLVSEDETIFYTQPYKDFTHLTLCTLNGAIIDGQNSIDCFKWIIDTVEKIIKKEELKDFEQNIKTFFKFNESKLEKFLNFLKKTDISINIEQTPDSQSAIKRAISKNNTMKVTESELAISDIQIPIQILANEVLEKDNINIDFPKKEIFIPSKELKENKIDIVELVRYLNCTKDFFNGKIKNSTAPFKSAQSLRGQNKPDFEILKLYVYKTTEETEDSKELRHEIKVYNGKYEENNNMFVTLNSLPESSKTADIKIVIEKLEDEMLKYKNEIERLQEKSKGLNDIAYKVKDRPRLVTIIKRIFVIKKRIEELYERLQQSDPQKVKMIKEYISSQEKITDYIFVMSLMKHPMDYTLLVRDVTILFEGLVKNIETIFNNYKVEMTTIRNSSDDNTPCLTSDGTSCRIKAVRDEFFKIP